MSCHATTPPSNCTCFPTPPPAPHFVLGHSSRYMLLPTVLFILICLLDDEKHMFPCDLLFSSYVNCLVSHPCLQAPHICPIST